MSVPEIKKLNSIGERLRRKREELGIGIKDLAGELQTSQRFVRALEEDHYEIFPAKVYARGFLQKIIVCLAMDEIKEERDSLLREFDAEWEIVKRRKENIPAIAPNIKKNAPTITPKRLGFIVVFAAISILLLFLALRISNFLKSPDLNIESPENKSVVYKPVIKVKGTGQRESQLTVNGREIRMDESGNFDEEIELLAGLNSLEFILQDRFGKEKREVKYVIVK